MSSDGRFSVATGASEKMDKKRKVRERFPTGPMIPLPYQFNMLGDAQRTAAFREVILSVVHRDHIVLDLGAGVGILSLFAAERAQRVIAVEADSRIASVARTAIRCLGLSQKVTVLIADILTLRTSIGADVCICEMIDAGLLSELQVPVMNYAISKLLKPNPVVIPRKAYLSIELVHVDYEFFGYTFPLPHYESLEVRAADTVLSNRMVYKTLNFATVNDVKVNETIFLTVTAPGLANSLRIFTSVEVGNGIIVGNTAWFAHPLILPFSDKRVAEGDQIRVHLRYEFGSGWDKLRYEVESRGDIQ
jgi:predicted RNA methylase